MSIRLSGTLFGAMVHVWIGGTTLIFFFSRNGSPILVTLVSFWHFAVYRHLPLTPSIAFTSILGMVQLPQLPSCLINETFVVFSEMKFALSALPETFINMLQVKKLSLPSILYLSHNRALYLSVVSKNT